MSRRSDVDVLLEVEPEPARPAPRPLEEPSFHVALLGDFRGRGDGDGPMGLQPVPVDRDDLDDVLARFGPAVWIGGAGAEGGVEVTFRRLDDFDPDRLLERVPLFRSVREAAGAGEPASRRNGGRSPEATAATEAPEAPSPPVEEMLSGGVLDRIVDEQSQRGEAGSGAGGGRRGGDPLRRWVDRLVRPHLEAAPDPDQARLAARVEEALADAMREVLRDPAFRRLEALWRGVDFLVRRVETDARLTLDLVDATAGRLASDDGLEAFRDLLRRGRRGEPWSVVALLWEVGPSAEELVLLREMARAAAASGTVLLAGARPSLAGLAALADAGDRGAWGEPDPLWTALRGEPEASSVGLALPRFLLRLPWGEEGVPCEALELEEIQGSPSPDDYLWGAAAIPVVLILARAFARAGADLLDELDPEVGGLPLHVHREDGEARTTPCTEAALTHDDADRSLDAGIMPFAWSRDSDRIRLVTLRSVAAPPAPLAGSWRG